MNSSFGDAKDIEVEKVYSMLETRFGFTRTSLMERKLKGIFQDLPYEEVRRTVDTLKEIPTYHPDWLKLINQLTLHETYFFRDPAQIDTINSLIKKLVDKAVQTNQLSLNICSAACSTGEEVYTLAILTLNALLEAGYASLDIGGKIVVAPEWKLQVVGFDISSIAIGKAKRAIYPVVSLGAFRDMAPKWEHWFETLKRTEIDFDCEYGSEFLKRPKPEVMAITKFEQHNLLNNIVYPAAFNLIVCRNVLIYFDQERKKQIQGNLINAISPKGYLVMGSVDTMIDSSKVELHSNAGLSYYIKK